MIMLTVSNIGEFQKMANSSPALAQKHAGNAIVRAIALIDTNKNPLTPVDTGRLRDSIHSGISFSPFKGRIGTTLPYAVSVHDMYPVGTPYKNPSKNSGAVAGFLALATEQSKEGIEKLFETALRNFIYELKNS